MSLIDDMKARAAAATAKATEVPEVPEVQSQTPVEEVKEKTYQTYKSGMDNQKMVMQSGKVIRITGGKYITDKEDEIAYLDYEIEQGLPYLQKTGTVTSADLDPMSSLRKQIIAEYVEAQRVAAETAAVASSTPAPDLGDTAIAPLTPASTAALGALAAGSNSAAE